MCEGKLKTERFHYISHHVLDSCHLDHSELAEHLQKCASRAVETRSRTTQDAKQSALSREQPHLR